MASYIVAWFKAQLQNKQQAQSLFKEGQGIFNDNDWEVSTKENNYLF
ncbi:hypothetical protein [Halanaerobacter jeridensis]|uniref:Uncharacterized protein n=1 Tax=Halanaerobacter jeridensis TaxID=706427 RepID=A0A938XQ32_9FIRM|nr:hypothetical protein [Halanaerobacter jeridensis]MBM7557292.1 hypothetical protein [Halanaerobacter jeridensis]